MAYRRAPLPSPPYGANRRVAGIASPPSPRLEETSLKASLVALARLLGAQAARESLQAEVAVARRESVEGIDD